MQYFEILIYGLVFEEMQFLLKSKVELRSIDSAQPTLQSNISRGESKKVVIDIELRSRYSLFVFIWHIYLLHRVVARI